MGKWDLKRFYLIDKSDYGLELLYQEKVGVFMDLWQKSIGKLHTKGIVVTDDPDTIEKWEIQDKQKSIMFPIVKRYIRKQVKTCQDLMKKKLIELMNYNIVSVEYSKKKDNSIDIFIKVTGQYIDKN